MSSIRQLTTDLPACGGRIRTVPEDFIVEEIPAYVPGGQGEHLFLWVEKRGLDTPQVARALATALGIPEREVAYAGLKDRQAVTRQFFSVPAVKAEPKLEGLSLSGVQVLSAKRHQNKLRSGHLRGNRFTLRIREVTDVGAAQASFQRLTSVGLPNFFGPQRFGLRGDNATHGFALLRGERLPTRPERFLRKLFLSAAQSALFNEALSSRMADGSWLRALEGDVLKKESGGAFVCVDPRIDQPRVDSFEVSPAGPLFGPKLLAAQGEVARMEAEVLARNGLAASDFLRGGDETLGARRAYRVRLEDPALVVDGPDVLVSFSLPSGSYASLVLSELLKSEAPPAVGGSFDEAP